MNDDLDAELQRRVAAETVMATALLELERHPGYRLLETISPTGLTARRWAAAQATLADLWQDFMRYRAVLAEAGEVRGRRPRPGGPERAALHRLLHEPCVEVGRTVAERRMSGPVEQVERITLGQLAERVEAAWAELDGLVESCAQRHSAHVAGLGPRSERAEALRVRSAELGTGAGAPPEQAAVAAVTERLTALAAAAADPLALSAGDRVFTALDVEIDAISARLDALAAVRDDWPSRLAEVTAALAELDELHTAERRTRAHATDRIAGHGLVAPAVVVTVLRERLARLGAPAGWAERARRLAELHAAVATTTDGLRAAHAQAAGLLERRAELRGRFEAYRAKAVRLGHAEDVALLGLGREVERLLWSRPCDLAAATRTLNGYRRTLSALESRRTA